MTASASRAAAAPRASAPGELPYGTLSLVAALALWWAATDLLGLGGGTTFASPGEVLGTARTLLAEPFAGATLAGHTLDSLGRWAAGVGIAIALGFPLGLLMGWNRSVDALVSPLFEPFRNLPPLAWVPLMIVWFGTSTLSQVAVVFVGAFPPCVLNAYAAIRSVEPIQLAAARTLGAGSWTRAVEIALPAGVPALIAGLRIAFGNAWMALIGAELVGAQSGLGFLIIRGQENLSAATIMVGMAVIALIGFALDAALAWLSRHALPWRQPPRAND